MSDHQVLTNRMERLSFRVFQGADMPEWGPPVPEMPLRPAL